MASLEIKSLLSYGFKETKKHFWFFFTVFLVIFGLNLGPYIVNEVLKNTDSVTLHLLGIMLHVVFFVIFLLTEVGLLRISIAITSRKTPKLSYLFHAEGKLLKYFIADTFFSIVAFFAFLFFVIPGLFWVSTFQFFGYSLIAKNLGPTESLTESSRITKGHKWDIIKIDLVLIFLNILGLLFFGIGLLITIPMSMIILAKVYKELEK